MLVFGIVITCVLAYFGIGILIEVIIDTIRELSDKHQRLLLGSLIDEPTLPPPGMATCIWPLVLIIFVWCYCHAKFSGLSKSLASKLTKLLEKDKK